MPGICRVSSSCSGHKPLSLFHVDRIDDQRFLRGEFQLLCELVQRGLQQIVVTWRGDSDEPFGLFVCDVVSRARGTNVCSMVMMSDGALLGMV